MELKTGDILHCQSKTLIGKLIKMFTKSKIIHTALVVEIWGQIYIVDAQKNGVRPRQYQEWLDKYNYKFKISRPLEDFDTKSFSLKAFSYVGNTGYDFFSLLVRFPIALIRGKWGKNKKDRNVRKMVCSEYVATVYGLPSAHRITPKDLFEYTNKCGKFASIKN